MLDDRPARRRHARPVADAPVAELVAAAHELAREWLVALIADRPLSGAAEVPVAQLAAEAPALCAAMARALASDEELDRLADGEVAARVGALAGSAAGAGDIAARAGAMAGAASPEAAAGAVELLRGVLWTACLDALRRPAPDQVADLAGRLSAVAAAVTAATLRGAGDRVPAPEGPGQDGFAPAGPEPPAVPPVGADQRSWSAGDAAQSVAEAVAADGEVRALDLRPRIGDGPPGETVARAVEHHLVDGRPLAVLLVELDGADRLLAAQFGDEADTAIAQAEAAIEALLRPGDTARREGPGRIWLTLPGTGPAGARALALRVGAGVARAAELRGAALRASVGVAMLGPDAPDAAALLDRAEESLFAARAAGA
jgi:GGDEF domain-containing protein